MMTLSIMCISYDDHKYNVYIILYDDVNYYDDYDVYCRPQPLWLDGGDGHQARRSSSVSSKKSVSRIYIS